MAGSLRRRLKQKTADQSVHADKSIYLQAIFKGKDPFRLAALDILDIGKGFVDTFKNYKSQSYVWADVATPLRGLGNIILSYFYAAMAVQFFAFNVLKSLTYDLFKYGPKACINSLGNAFYGLVGGLAKAVTTAVRGALEVATAPLVWFLRMPIRGLIYLSRNGYQRFEENAGVQRLIKEGRALLLGDEPQSREMTKEIIYHLERKYTKFTDTKAGRGQPSRVKDWRKPEHKAAFQTVQQSFFDEKNADKTKGQPLTAQEKADVQTYLNCFRNTY